MGLSNAESTTNEEESLDPEDVQQEDLFRDGAHPPSRYPAVAHFDPTQLSTTSTSSRLPLFPEELDCRN